MKKILSIALVVVLLAGIAVSGTMAYLQDSDSDVNVMTLGNVDIEQIEEQLAADGASKEPFVQGKDFYPGTSISKIVSVKNTGKSDAYFRTLIAFEDIDSETFGIGPAFTDTAYTIVPWGGDPVAIEIDGVNYVVYEFIHKTVLPAGKTSEPSLYKVDMAATATSEDMELLGDTYDILVLSQAVQAEGFADANNNGTAADEALEAAFGKVADKAAEWFGGDEFTVPTAVATAEELTAALAAGESVYLTEDVELTEIVNINKPTNINLNGKNLTVSVLEAKADTTISNGTVTHGKSTYPALSVSVGTLTMENVEVFCDEPCNIVTSDSAEAAEFVALEIWSGKAVLNNCDIVAKTDKIRYSNSIFGIGIHGGELTMNGGSITVESHGSTKPKYDYQSAIFAGSATEKTVNLNDVKINLKSDGKLLFAWGGNTTVNTTAADGTWAAEKIDARNGGTYTINYVK